MVFPSLTSLHGFSANYKHYARTAPPLLVRLKSSRACPEAAKLVRRERGKPRDTTAKVQLEAHLEVQLKVQ